MVFMSCLTHCLFHSGYVGHRTSVSYVDNYFFNSMAYLIRSGLVIRCKSDEFNVFNPPSGSTCQAWAGQFVSAFGGYLDNPNDTQACRYCQYAVCDFILSEVGLAQRYITGGRRVLHPFEYPFLPQVERCFYSLLIYQ
jgi:hypothetical protein